MRPFKGIFCDDISEFESSLGFQIVLGEIHEHADAPHDPPQLRQSLPERRDQASSRFRVMVIRRCRSENLSPRS